MLYVTFCSDRLECARKGHSLFKGVVEEEEARAKAEILKFRHESESSKRAWLPPGDSRLVVSTISHWCEHTVDLII